MLAAVHATPIPTAAEAETGLMTRIAHATATGEHLDASLAAMEYTLQRDADAASLVGGPLHDLGQLLMSQYQAQDAWRCFDAARLVDPKHELVLPIPGFEDSLQKEYPVFY